MHAPKEEKEHLVIRKIPANGLLPRAGVGSGPRQQGHGVSWR
jgi:hypothetical protein